MIKVNVEQQYQYMQKSQNEKQWRQYLALEAKRKGNIARVAKAANVSRNTIKRGIREIEAGEAYTEGARIRKTGGGRKSIKDTDPTLLTDLDNLIDDTKGNPMNFIKWTTKSVTHLRVGLEKLGYTIKDTSVHALLHNAGVTKRALFLILFYFAGVEELFYFVEGFSD